MKDSRAVPRIASFCRRYFHGRMYLHAMACAVFALALSPPLFAANTIVRMEITYGANQGTVDIELYDDQAPITVANFLHYAGRGDYSNNGFIHRHATMNSSGVSVLQGGGYIYGVAPPFGLFVTRMPVLDPPIKNEFSLSRSNIRGTIAMAQLGGQPDSATSEWYFKLDNNSAALDNTANSGGFTVFGRVLDTGPSTGMAVLDAISNLPIWNLTSVNGALGTIPLDNFDSAAGLQPNNLVKVTRIPNIRSMRTELGTMPIFTADVDMAFEYVSRVATGTALTLLATFTSPSNQSARFNNGMYTLKLTGPLGTTGRIVTLHDGATERPTHYYAYGKTSDNPTDHWYDFSYDGETGAEIKSDRIILHFVDGKRGDEDLDPTNNSITHTGAQAVVTTTGSTQSAQSGGCSIATMPSKTPRGGDWIAVSLFLGMLTLVRRRARRQIQHERVTNIASP